MMADLIIKFGGSAVTVKEQLETLKDDSLDHACSFAKYWIQQNKRVIIVHGAGSYGHHQARQYNINSGYKDISEKDAEKTKQGFCLTRVSVTKLNHVIVERLCKIGINAVGIPAFGQWVTDNRKVIQHNVDLIQSVLDNGLVPVLHGDCVFDSCHGCVILSGDIIIKTICKVMEVQNVVFLTDVDGIFDKSPKEKDAQLIPEVLADRLSGNIVANICTDQNSDYDVTGGIDLKLKTAKSIVLASNGKLSVWICNVQHEPALVFTDSNFRGTIVKLKDYS